MKILVLSVVLLLSVVTGPVFSEEGKTIDIKGMAKMAQAMKSNESLINDPKAMAAMMSLAGSFKAAQETKLE